MQGGRRVADEAARHENHHEHEQYADDDMVVGGVGAHDRAQPGQDCRPVERTDKRSCPTHDDIDDRVARNLEEHQFRRDESAKHRIEPATDTGNTRKIANTCGQIIESAVETSPFAPEGSATQVVVFKDRADAKTKATKAVEYFAKNLKIPLGKIACLSPYSPEKSSLSGGKIGDYATTDKLETWRKGGAVWLSSIKAFKGLEADAIVLTDLPDFKQGFFDKADFYVACSRAKQLLVVLTSSLEVSSLGEKI